MDSYARKHNRVNIDSLSFEVVSYKVDHVSSVNSYFTISGDTGMYLSGVRPYILTLRCYFPKSDKNVYILSLESLIFTSKEISFSLDGLSFDKVLVSRYSFKDEVSSMVQEVEITIMGSGEITEEQEVEN